MLPKPQAKNLWCLQLPGWDQASTLCMEGVGFGPCRLNQYFGVLLKAAVLCLQQIPRMCMVPKLGERLAGARVRRWPVYKLCLRLFLPEDIVFLQQVPFERNGSSNFIKTDLCIAALLLKWLSKLCVMHSTRCTFQEEVEVRCLTPLLRFYRTKSGSSTKS